MMTKNILALIDFSRTSGQVVTRAGDLALFYDAKCWLIHVATPDPEFVGYNVGPQYIRDHRAGVLRKEHQKLEAYKAELLQKNIDCEILLVQGQTNPTIMEEIDKLNIDMIVLGSHGRTRLYDLLVGSVCEYLLRYAPVPLVIIPGPRCKSKGEKKMGRGKKKGQ
jgi:nucleotide-binding universal stress UspA family protein